MTRRIGILGIVVGSTLLCAPVFAEKPDDTGQQPAATQAPWPPGLEKEGTLPHGLEKQGKTPHGWGQGNAWWKQGGQAPQGSHPRGDGGVFSGGHSGRANPGHGQGRGHR